MFAPRNNTILIISKNSKNTAFCGIQITLDFAKNEKNPSDIR